MKSEFRRIVVFVPAFRQRWNRIHGLRIIFDQTFVEGHQDARFGEACSLLRIKTLRLVARNVTQDVAGRWSYPAEKFFLACQGLAGDGSDRERDKHEACKYLS